MSRLPTLAIVTPSYNQAPYIEQAMDSVLSAKGKIPLVYAVIDGGSTDGTVDILRRYEKHLDFWVSEKDSGQSNAINKGLRRLGGDIWGYLNSDDYYADGALIEVVETFASTETHWVTGTGRYFTDDGSPVRDMVPTEDWTLKDVLIGLASSPVMVSSQVSNFMSREMLSRYGYFDEALHYVMDIDLALRLLMDGIRPTVLKRVLGMARLHEESKTVSQGRIAFPREYEKVLARLDLSAQPELDQVRNDVVRQLGKRNALNTFFDGQIGNHAGRKALSAYLKSHPRAIFDREILGAIRRFATSRF